MVKRRIVRRKRRVGRGRGIISTLAPSVGGLIGGPAGGQIGSIVGSIASMFGLGRKRRVRRKRTAVRRVRGRGVGSFLKKVGKFAMPHLKTLHNYVKSNKVISSQLQKRGYTTGARVARHFGYGSVKLMSGGGYLPNASVPLLKF